MSDEVVHSILRRDNQQPNGSITTASRWNRRRRWKEKSGRKSNLSQIQPTNRCATTSFAPFPFDRLPPVLSRPALDSIVRTSSVLKRLACSLRQWLRFLDPSVFGAANGESIQPRSIPPRTLLPLRVGLRLSLLCSGSDSHHEQSPSRLPWPRKISNGRRMIDLADSSCLLPSASWKRGCCPSIQWTRVVKLWLRQCTLRSTFSPLCKIFPVRPSIRNAPLVFGKTTTSTNCSPRMQIDRHRWVHSLKSSLWSVFIRENPSRARLPDDEMSHLCIAPSSTTPDR